MTLEQIFIAANGLALLGWILLAFAPRWRLTHALVVSGGGSLLLAALYLALFVIHLDQQPAGIGSLQDVADAFSRPAIALIAWVHFLAFDLFIGAWGGRDAQSRGVPHLALLPCLFMTFMLGPIGLLLYFAVRLVLGRDPARR